MKPHNYHPVWLTIWLSLGTTLAQQTGNTPLWGSWSNTGPHQSKDAQSYGYEDRNTGSTGREPFFQLYEVQPSQESSKTICPPSSETNGREELKLPSNMLLPKRGIENFYCEVVGAGNTLTLTPKVKRRGNVVLFQLQANGQLIRTPPKLNAKEERVNFTLLDNGILLKEKTKVIENKPILRYTTTKRGDFKPLASNNRTYESSSRDGVLYIEGMDEMLIPVTVLESDKVKYYYFGTHLLHTDSLSGFNTTSTKDSNFGLVYLTESSGKTLALTPELRDGIVIYNLDCDGVFTRNPAKPSDIASTVTYLLTPTGLLVPTNSQQEGHILSYSVTGMGSLKPLRNNKYVFETPRAATQQYLLCQNGMLVPVTIKVTPEGIVKYFFYNYLVHTMDSGYETDSSSFYLLGHYGQLVPYTSKSIQLTKAQKYKIKNSNVIPIIEREPPIIPVEKTSESETPAVTAVSEPKTSTELAQKSFLLDAAYYITHKKKEIIKIAPEKLCDKSVTVFMLNSVGILIRLPSDPYIPKGLEMTYKMIGDYILKPCVEPSSEDIVLKFVTDDNGNMIPSGDNKNTFTSEIGNNIIYLLGEEGILFPVKKHTRPDNSVNYYFQGYLIHSTGTQTTSAPYFSIRSPENPPLAVLNEKKVFSQLISGKQQFDYSVKPKFAPRSAPCCYVSKSGEKYDVKPLSANDGVVVMYRLTCSGTLVRYPQLPPSCHGYEVTFVLQPDNFMLIPKLAPCSDEFWLTYITDANGDLVPSPNNINTYTRAPGCTIFYMLGTNNILFPVTEHVNSKGTIFYSYDDHLVYSSKHEQRERSGTPILSKKYSRRQEDEDEERQKQPKKMMQMVEESAEYDSIEDHTPMMPAHPEHGLNKPPPKYSEEDSYSGDSVDEDEIPRHEKKVLNKDGRKISPSIYSDYSSSASDELYHHKGYKDRKRSPSPQQIEEHKQSIRNSSDTGSRKHHEFVPVHPRNLHMRNQQGCAHHEQHEEKRRFSLMSPNRKPQLVVHPHPAGSSIVRNRLDEPEPTRKRTHKSRRQRRSVNQHEGEISNDRVQLRRKPSDYRFEIYPGMCGMKPTLTPKAQCGNNGLFIKYSPDMPVNNMKLYRTESHNDLLRTQDDRSRDTKYPYNEGVLKQKVVEQQTQGRTPVVMSVIHGGSNYFPSAQSLKTYYVSAPQNHNNENTKSPLFLVQTDEENRAGPGAHEAVYLIAIVPKHKSEPITHIPQPAPHTPEEYPSLYPLIVDKPKPKANKKPCIDLNDPLIKKKLEKLLRHLIHGNMTLTSSWAESVPSSAEAQTRIPRHNIPKKSIRQQILNEKNMKLQKSLTEQIDAILRIKPKTYKLKGKYLNQNRLESDELESDPSSEELLESIESLEDSLLVSDETDKFSCFKTLINNGEKKNLNPGRGGSKCHSLKVGRRLMSFDEEDDEFRSSESYPLNRSYKRYPERGSHRDHQERTRDYSERRRPQPVKSESRKTKECKACESKPKSRHHLQDSEEVADVSDCGFHDYQNIFQHNTKLTRSRSDPVIKNNVPQVRFEHPLGHMVNLKLKTTMNNRVVYYTQDSSGDLVPHPTEKVPPSLIHKVISYQLLQDGSLIPINRTRPSYSTVNMVVKEHGILSPAKDNVNSIPLFTYFVVSHENVLLPVHGVVRGKTISFYKNNIGIRTQQIGSSEEDIGEVERKHFEPSPVEKVERVKSNRRTHEPHPIIERVEPRVTHDSHPQEEPIKNLHQELTQPERIEPSNRRTHYDPHPQHDERAQQTRHPQSDKVHDPHPQTERIHDPQTRIIDDSLPKLDLDKIRNFQPSNTKEYMDVVLPLAEKSTSHTNETAVMIQAKLDEMIDVKMSHEDLKILVANKMKELFETERLMKEIKKRLTSMPASEKPGKKNDTKQNH